MNNDDKNDCIDAVALALEKTAAWRRNLAIKFPNNPRLPRAATTLQNLAREAASLRDDQWKILCKHWDSEQWQMALHDTARAVGFHVRAGTFDIFLNALLQRLTVAVGVAA